LQLAALGQLAEPLTGRGAASSSAKASATGSLPVFATVARAAAARGAALPESALSCLTEFFQAVFRVPRPSPGQVLPRHADAASTAAPAACVAGTVPYERLRAIFTETATPSRCPLVWQQPRVGSGIGIGGSSPSLRAKQPRASAPASSSQSPRLRRSPAAAAAERAAKKPRRRRSPAAAAPIELDDEEEDNVIVLDDAPAAGAGKKPSTAAGMVSAAAAVGSKRKRPHS